jgi:hypothetical protein
MSGIQPPSTVRQDIFKGIQGIQPGGAPFGLNVAPPRQAQPLQPLQPGGALQPPAGQPPQMPRRSITPGRPLAPRPLNPVVK